MNTTHLRVGVSAVSFFSVLINVILVLSTARSVNYTACRASKRFGGRQCNDMDMYTGTNDALVIFSIMVMIIDGAVLVLHAVLLKFPSKLFVTSVC
jgi:hypothetical protein